jgi:Cdc6-like AAA superfamily ATPase
MPNPEIEWFAKGVQAGRIFTPTTPVDEKSLFAGRNEQVRSVIDVINQKGQHGIVYGERGVGKTSLMNVLHAFLGMPNVVAPRINCDSSDTFHSVWEKSLAQAALTRTQRGIGFTSSAKTNPVEPRELLGRKASPDSVRRALSSISGIAAAVIFILDEFDRLPDNVRHTFADTVKALSDHAVPVTLILVGVADSVKELIAEHHSVERALVQIQMPRMSAFEIKQIVENGLSKLGMTGSSNAIRQIVKLSQGLPHYAHLLGLHSVRAAIDSQTFSVEVEAVRSAIDRAIKGANQSIRTAYEQAVRSARKDNLFADVLLACALAETSDLGFFAAQDVRGPMCKITGKEYQIPSFAQHLNEFCDEKRGPILQKTGSKRLYRYRFTNPLLQPHVIMQGIQGGRITSADLG